MTAGSSNGQERSALWVVAFFPDKEGGDRAFVCHPTHALVGADESRTIQGSFFT